ncbi:MAG TPA: response regulator transcription factor [Nocardioides sp.]|jgi:DNA-binding response OmpR family regulator|uniref:response regulator transcription factor n=1 Tax=Nocardioides sp. TaxID=35761 RepID=UPI002E308E30|nr:response regulator transcription factor [Nocardioides sp.]HEX3931500.1 response regulator transcription factor [Nocardioides sp.]
MRLLVVEDEVRLARALERGLTADGFTVDVARDGARGLELARTGRFDAVLLDVMIPEISGYEVVKRLRAEDNWVPVMMVSAKDGPHDQADGLDYGADDYLTKPFDYVVLLARLRALLRRPSDPRPPVLQHGGVQLDPATREVTVGGEPVSLSRREHDLLEFFLRHPDRVITRTELLDRVWDAVDGYEPNTVEVYVGYLRRKLGSQVIVTVRGSGYRLASVR